MKNKKFCSIAALLLVCILGLVTACGAPMGKGSLDNADITYDYLKDEYPEMLLTDGAEHLIGSIEFSKAEDGSLQVILHPKEAASKANDDGTYTVSSYAINRVLVLSDSMFGVASGSEDILSMEEFPAVVQGEFDDSIMYDVYTMDDQILLIMYNPDYVLPDPGAK